jgi:hypothetical protein
MVKSGIGFLFVTCLLLPACGGDDEASPNGQGDEIEIEGSWTSNFGGTEVIDHHSWSADFGTGPTVSEIVEFSNDGNDAVLKGPDDLYSRYVWTEVSGDAFHYCTVAFGKASAELAVSDSEVADDSDPDTTGCAAFPWTKLTRE